MRRQGLAYKEIAPKLGISIHTVKTHMKRVMEKTGTMSSLAAIYAMQLACKPTPGKESITPRAKKAGYQACRKRP